MCRPKIIASILAIVDIIFGLCLLPYFVVFQGAFIILFLGLLYVIFGFGVVSHTIKKKLLLFGILPLTLLFSLSITSLGSGVETPLYYRTPIMVKIIIIGFLLSICLVNIYLFVGSKGANGAGGDGAGGGDKPSGEKSARH